MSVSENKLPRYTIVDGHEDIAFNVLALQRNFLDEISTLRHQSADKKGGIPTVSLPELEKGNVRVVFATLWVHPLVKSPVTKRIRWKTSEEAHVEALAQLNYYREIQNKGFVNIIETKSQLNEHLCGQTKVGLIILMEGATPIRIPKEAKDWFDMGVRIIGPAWHRTQYSAGTGTPGTLTEKGKELMTEMEKAGLILDVSHMADESFFDALDLFHGNIIASHSNCRKYIPTDRHLTDEMIKKLISRGGVIGTVFYNKFLDPNWKKGCKNKVTLLNVNEHMKHICELSGDSLHSAIGSDLDGGFGSESTPQDVDTVADLQKFGDVLGRNGFSGSDTTNIMADNWLRLLERALPGS
jgi:membrane dipeptidase